MVTYRVVSPPVGVFGIGVVSAFGTTHHSFVDALLSGRSAVAPLTGFDASACRTQLAAQTSTFQPTEWVSPMKLRRLERTGAYAVALARLTLDDANYAVGPDGHDDAGVVLGTWTAGGQSTQTYLSAFFGGGPANAPALLFESTVGNAATSLAGIEFKLRGPNVTISQKEASGLAAVITAVDLLRARRASGLMAGGVDGVYETFFRALDRFGVMSPAASFSRQVAPFDADRAGFVLGEGGFGVWLQPSDDAGHSNGHSPRHGWIVGTAAASVSVPLNAWPDKPDALVRTMRRALDDAGLSPSDVDVVYASANATRVLDAAEASALQTLFGGSRTVITSVKGALGEGGTSSAAACAAALLCGRQGRVPPIAGLVESDSSASGLRLARTAMDAPGAIALVNSFASGGALFSAVLQVAA